MNISQVHNLYSIILRAYILLPVMLFITSCTFYIGSLEHDERLVLVKHVTTQNFSSPFKQHQPITAFDVLTCTEPPLEAPHIRHTAFEICLAYANLAIDDQGYKTQLAKAIEMDHSAILAAAAFNAMSNSSMSEERAEEIRRLIYSIYGAPLPSFTEPGP